jgi:hypothetical protein
MPDFTLGFKNGGDDITAESVLSNDKCTVGYGVTLTANLWNLGCPAGQAGTVDFYWVPLGGTPSSMLANVLAMDGQLNTNIQPGEYLPATYLWVPSTPGKGQIFCQAHAIQSDRCDQFDPPDYGAPYSATSVVIHVFAAETPSSQVLKPADRK